MSYEDDLDYFERSEREDREEMEELMSKMERAAERARKGLDSETIKMIKCKGYAGEVSFSEEELEEAREILEGVDFWGEKVEVDKESQAKAIDEMIRRSKRQQKMARKVLGGAITPEIERCMREELAFLEKMKDEASGRSEEAFEEEDEEDFSEVAEEVEVLDEKEDIEQGYGAEEFESFQGTHDCQLAMFVYGLIETNEMGRITKWDKSQRGFKTLVMIKKHVEDGKRSVVVVYNEDEGKFYGNLVKDTYWIPGMNGQLYDSHFEVFLRTILDAQVSDLPTRNGCFFVPRNYICKFEAGERYDWDTDGLFVKDESGEYTSGPLKLPRFSDDPKGKPSEMEIYEFKSSLQRLSEEPISEEDFRQMAKIMKDWDI